ncbi:hypothetical protein MHBO_000332 [Bonamia ostreae]|uniref:Uncharacterized protein n=1 Tax=Bonamia ostreae TaxID=126728 RepID=A0ABV2AG37_9EUKA
MKAITEKQLDDETIQTIKGCFQAVLEDLFNGEPPVVISAIESFMKTASAHNSEIIIKVTLSHKNTSRRIEFGEITKIKERVVSNITQNNELKLRAKIEDVEINFDN